MSGFGDYYNVEEVEVREGYEDLPEGTYCVAATSGEIKINKSATGTMQTCVFSVLEGACANKTIMHFFNIVHNNPQAEQIGRADLKQFCTACGKPDAVRLDEVLQVPLKVIVKKEKKDPTRTGIVKFLPLSAPTSFSGEKHNTTGKPSWVK